MVEDSCQAGTGATDDTTCDGVDDDCDGAADEDYVPTPTTCGVGACVATGMTSCVTGAVEDSCEAGTGASDDTTCDGVDDDCDGTADEDYASTPTTCGVGECTGNTGQLECAAGSEIDTCDPLAGAVADDQCDGLDNDCDGAADDEYIPIATTCGIGQCAGNVGLLACVGGSAIDTCNPLAGAAADDSVCDGLDDDCDGSADEDAAGIPTICGQGECSGNPGVTTCTAGVAGDTCDPFDGAAADDSVCNGLDDDCDGTVDEDCADTNVIVNGDFSSGKAPWILHSDASASLNTGSGEARVSISTSGTNVQLYQKNLVLKGDTDYRLTFDARHSAGKAIKVHLIKHTSPYNNYGLGVSNVVLAAGMQTYSFEFTTTSGDKIDGRFRFRLDQNDDPGSEFAFDNVSIVEVPAGPCGNGLLDPGEACDAGLLDGATCVSQGYDGGTLSCNATCDGFVTSACYECGDGAINPGEICDGADLGGDTCSDHGFDGGVLACNATCDGFDTASCTTCGDGTVDPGEECDDGGANSDTTPNACRTDCTLPGCGDGVMDIGEACDNGAANSDTAPDACRTTCDLPTCGDGVTDGGESCDDGNTVDTDACTNSCLIGVSPINVIANGDFSAGKPPWKFNGDGSAVFSISGGEARVSVTSSGSKVQLYQPGVQLKGNTTYVLTFRARHTATGWIKAHLIKHTSPYTNYGLNFAFHLTSTMQTHSVEFTTTAGDKTDARFRLRLDGADVDGSTFYFDDVTIVEKTP